VQPFQVEAFDGTLLAARDWRPTGEARGTVLLVHGLGEHLGRYGHVAETLRAAGWRVLGADLRGHGASGGRRGHVRRFGDYGRDLRTLAGIIGGPFQVLAQSTGALAVLDGFRGHALGPDRLVFSSPLVGLDMHAPAWKRLLAPVLSAVLPILPIGNEIKLQDLTTDAEVLATYRVDALRVPTVTPRWYTEMNAALRRVREAPLPALPLQLHVAGDERILDRDAVDRFHETWPDLVERHEWPRMRHDLMMEPCAEELLEQVLTFLDSA